MQGSPLQDILCVCHFENSGVSRPALGEQRGHGCLRSSFPSGLQPELPDPVHGPRAVEHQACRNVPARLETGSLKEYGDAQTIPSNIAPECGKAPVGLRSVPSR